MKPTPYTVSVGAAAYQVLSEIELVNSLVLSVQENTFKKTTVVVVVVVHNEMGMRQPSKDHGPG